MDSATFARMLDLSLGLKPCAAATIRGLLLVVGVLAAAHCGSAQDTPLISGGAGFFTQTNAGNTTYYPTIEPLLAVPIGQHVLVESRASLFEFFAPNGIDDPGYNRSHFIGLTYLQGDFIASRHFTLVAGDYLIPFNTYNDRLSPIWISNFQDGPLIANLSFTSSGSGLGGMLRGNAIQRKKYSIDYSYYYSTRSANEQFGASRGNGGRSSLYLPEQRLELGLSYNRLLQGTGGSRRIRPSGCARNSHAAIMRRDIGLRQTIAPRPSEVSTAQLAASSLSSECSRLSVATLLSAMACQLRTHSELTLALTTTCRTT